MDIGPLQAERSPSAVAQGFEQKQDGAAFVELAAGQQKTPSSAERLQPFVPGGPLGRLRLVPERVRVEVPSLDQRRQAGSQIR